jgi:hypothetical protein
MTNSADLTTQENDAIFKAVKTNKNLPLQLATYLRQSRTKFARLHSLSDVDERNAAAHALGREEKAEVARLFHLLPDAELTAPLLTVRAEWREKIFGTPAAKRARKSPSVSVGPTLTNSDAEAVLSLPEPETEMQLAAQQQPVAPARASAPAQPARPASLVARAAPGAQSLRFELPVTPALVRSPVSAEQFAPVQKKKSIGEAPRTTMYVGADGTHYVGCYQCGHTIGLDNPSQHYRSKIHLNGAASAPCLCAGHCKKRASALPTDRQTPQNVTGELPAELVYEHSSGLYVKICLACGSEACGKALANWEALRRPVPAAALATPETPAAPVGHPFVPEHSASNDAFDPDALF